MDHERTGGRTVVSRSPRTDTQQHTQVAGLNQPAQSVMDSWNCPPPSPYSLAMMKETIAISQSIEHDPRSFDLPYPSVSSDNDVTPTMDFSWEYPVGDGQYGRERCLRAPEKGMCDAAEAVWPFALIKNEPNKELELGSVSLAPTSCEQAGTVGLPAGELNPLGTADSIPGQLYQGAEGLPDNANETYDGTSSDLSPTETGSAARTASVSPTTTEVSLDHPAGGEQDIKRHREKNRVAARKCRQKAKRNTAGLQQRERELRQQNQRLLSHISGLRDEILDLKDEILRHSACESSVIQNYIESAARRQMTN
ncbi:hypothetical protein GGR51DRAFT_153809 [Nemania sp. FL0031]|nr:hypothetical protein GGR51DRAFT_153809 [Nemania sp. FL0031]